MLNIIIQTITRSPSTYAQFFQKVVLVVFNHPKKLKFYIYTELAIHLETFHARDPIILPTISYQPRVSSTITNLSELDLLLYSIQLIGAHSPASKILASRAPMLILQTSLLSFRSEQLGSTPRLNKFARVNYLLLDIENCAN